MLINTKMSDDRASCDSASSPSIDITFESLPLCFHFSVVVGLDDCPTKIPQLLVTGAETADRIAQRIELCCAKSTHAFKQRLTNQAVSVAKVPIHRALGDADMLTDILNSQGIRAVSQDDVKCGINELCSLIRVPLRLCGFRLAATSGCPDHDVRLGRIVHSSN